MYTARSNLVAVVTNGTAVLGLGNIGPLASKPVMEGKGVLFKRFAGIDVFDIELASEDPEKIIEACQMLEPTFGGINLEDIRAPECFEIEERLIEALEIPVFHDDQHGTAIISAAAFLNALELTGRRIEDTTVVFAGAGAAGIACADLYLKLGVRRRNILMTDSRGVIYAGRTEGMNPYKERFAVKTDKRSLAEALDGADCFVGVSAAGLVTREMVASMAPDPLIFAMANPDPEITPDEVASVRDDAIMATGRSDYPNQVNNVLGFPFIFRGALDVRARKINDEMKLAAVHALADLARQGEAGLSDEVRLAYPGERFEFGRNYIIPKPFDPRVLIRESIEVARAAMETGVARIRIDLDEYRESLESRLGGSRSLMRFVINVAKGQPKRIVFPEGDEERVLRAALILKDEGMCEPVLLGDQRVRSIAESFGIDLGDIPVVDPRLSERAELYTQELGALRGRKGVTETDAARLLKRRSYFGAMMVRMGDAEGLIAGLTMSYGESIRPALRVVGLAEGQRRAAGVYVVIQEDRVLFFRGRLGQPRAVRRGTGRHRGSGSFHRRMVRFRACGGDALLRELRKRSRLRPRPRPRGARGGDRARALARAETRRRDASGHRPRPRTACRPLSVLRAGRGRQRAGLPQPGRGPHRRTPDGHGGRRDRGRADPDGHAAAGELGSADRQRR